MFLEQLRVVQGEACSQAHRYWLQYKNRGQGLSA
jgi:hypothetical protein